MKSHLLGTPKCRYLLVGHVVILHSVSVLWTFTAWILSATLVSVFSIKKKSGWFAQVSWCICAQDCVPTGCVYLCVQAHPRMQGCVPGVISYHLSLPYNGHMIAENSSQMLRQMLCPLSQKCTSVINLWLWQPSGPRNIFSSKKKKKHTTFLSWHWQIGLIDFVESYCDHSVLGQVPDFCAINHGKDDSRYSHLQHCRQFSNAVPRSFCSQ